jgi:CDP-diacylglycerol---glycerol-3-phosphate 3-phosphatidyltransferase
MTMTLYGLKPRFQALLRPSVRKLATAGVTANQVTAAAALGSLLLGALLAVLDNRAFFLLLPLWLFLRMALNAVDGMLAREFGQKSELGAYLNELGDLVSDAALYLPFALIAPFGATSVVIFVVLALLSEVAGILGPMIGASRRYDGPMGKSDRALACGALGLWVGVAALPAWAAWIMPTLSLALIACIFNRVRAGLAEHRGG